MEEVKTGCADITERLHELTRRIVERTGVSLEEAAGYISKALQTVKDQIAVVVGVPAEMLEAFEENEILDIEPRDLRRKAERDRAQIVEHTYRAKIKQFERARPFKRIYKPP